MAQNHEGALMCMREVGLCRETSIGTSFVALVGDRYGRRPLPSKVPLEDFAVLEQFAETDEEDELLKRWYLLDKNAVPEEWVLRGKGEAETAWQEAEPGLRPIFERALDAAQQGLLAFPNHERYLLSVTEMELREGLDSGARSLLFLRTLSNLDALHPGLPKHARKYVDFVPDQPGYRDPEAVEQLERMKTTLIPATIAESSVARFAAEFDPQEGLNSAHPATKTYLEEFGRLFLSRVKAQVEAALSAEAKQSLASDGSSEAGGSGDDLASEVAAQAGFVIEKAKLYCGRREVLRRLQERLLARKQSQALVLHGPSGAGKTATVAKLIRHLATRKTQAELQPRVVYRFLGTTPASSSLNLLLESLIEQIREIYNLASPETRQCLTGHPQSADDFGFICWTPWRKIGDSAPPLIIILDSLDQLSDSFQAHQLAWLAAY